MMLWLRTYPTFYMLSAMFGVSKSTDENVITGLAPILLANLKRYIKWPSLKRVAELYTVEVKLLVKSTAKSVTLRTVLLGEPFVPLLTHSNGCRCYKKY